ncbi:MAG: glycosyltransferase family 39 protein [Candidatus Omnitrophica bacterium]|nr:glycosyltransferase family 39 protein [Candidatus Omnitrophota bacterium]
MELDRKDYLSLSLFLCVFFLLEAYQIHLPGLYADEAFPATGAVQVLKHVGPFLISKELFGMSLPIAFVPYMTCLESYILMPFFYLFGINVFVLRSVPILLGGLVLVFTYIFIRRIFNRTAAVIAVLLLMVNPEFLIGTKLGNDSGSMLQFMNMAAILCFYNWYRLKKDRHFFAAVFFWGAGLSIRPWFSWPINSIIIISIVFYRYIGKAVIAKLRSAKFIAGSLFGFASGAFLMLFYNFSSGFPIIGYMTKYIYATRCGVNNLAYLNNLMSRVAVFKNYLRGTFSLGNMGGWNHRTPVEHISADNLYPALFLISAAWLLLSSAANKGRFSRKGKLFVLLFPLFILLQSPFTLSSLGGPHLFIIYPFIQVIIAVAFIEMLLIMKNKVKIAACFAVCVFLVPVFSEIKTAYRNNYAYIAGTGGTGNYSDAIYDLNRWLLEEGALDPVVLDWGIYHDLIFLSGGRISPVTFNFVESGDSKDVMMERLSNIIGGKQDKVYIFHSPKFTNRYVYDDFNGLVRHRGKRAIMLKEFSQRDGEKVFIVYAAGR